MKVRADNLHICHLALNMSLDTATADVLVSGTLYSNSPMTLYLDTLIQVIASIVAGTVQLGVQTW
jgi:hypothetical protein